MRALVAAVVCAVLCPQAVRAQPALPPPDPPFQGTLERTLAGSTPQYPRPVRAPAGAPNILVVLVDDAGFGNPSTFGGPVQTPTLDRLAQEGLRYNRFHVTALCSPTCAAMLSGIYARSYVLRADLDIPRNTCLPASGAWAPTA